MKVRYAFAFLAVIVMAFPCVAQEKSAFSAETNFCATDFLVVQSEPQFVVGNFYFYWDGALSIFNDSELEILEANINSFGNLEFFAAPVDDSAENIFFVAGTIGSSIDGRAWLEVDIYTGEEVFSKRSEQLFPGFAWVIISQLCECDDGITLTCTQTNCKNGDDCPNGTGKDKCYMKLPVLELISVAFTSRR